MKRMALAFLVIFMCLVPAIEAAQYNWVLAGGIGYLSSYSSPTVFFNAVPGTQLLLAAIPIDYSSTTGFCGLARLSDPSNLIVYGYSNTYIYTSIVADDLYLFLCVKSAGVSGNILLVSGDRALMGQSIQDEQQEPLNYIYPQELIDRLKAQIMMTIQ